MTADLATVHRPDNHYVPDEMRAHEAKTLRLLAEKLHGMALIGGSPALTRALTAVKDHVARLADEVAAGAYSLHDRSPAATDHQVIKETP